MEDLEKQNEFENILGEHESTLLVKEGEENRALGATCTKVIVCCETIRADECTTDSGQICICRKTDSIDIGCLGDEFCRSDCSSDCSSDCGSDTSTIGYTWMLVWAAAVSGSVKTGSLNYPVAGAYQLSDAYVTPNSGSVSSYLTSSFITTYNPFGSYNHYHDAAYGVTYFWKSGNTTTNMRPFLASWSSATATAYIGRNGHKPQFNKTIRIVGRTGQKTSWVKYAPNAYFGPPNTVVSLGWAKKFRLPQARYNFYVSTSMAGDLMAGVDVFVANKISNAATSAFTGVHKTGVYGQVTLITSAWPSTQSVVVVHRDGSNFSKATFLSNSGLTMYLSLSQLEDKSNCMRFEDAMNFDASVIRGLDEGDYEIDVPSRKRIIRHINDGIYLNEDEFSDVTGKSAQRNMAIPKHFFQHTWLTPTYFRNDENQTKLLGTMNTKAQFPLVGGDFMLRGIVIGTTLSFLSEDVVLSGVTVTVANGASALTNSYGYYEIPSGMSDTAGTVVFSRDGYTSNAYSYPSSVPSVVGLGQDICFHDSA